MSIANSVLEDLLGQLPHLRPQTYFKTSLTALSHAMEDLILAGTGGDRPLVIASFQQERFYQQEARRYHRIADHTDQVYVLAAPESEFCNASGAYETIAFGPKDALSQEWHLIAIGDNYATSLVCVERAPVDVQDRPKGLFSEDRVRRFEGIWTFDRRTSCVAAHLMLDRIVHYRPELAAKIATTRSRLICDDSVGFCDTNPEPFALRLVTYLQAGQYRLLKAYRSIATQERKERLTNSIVSTIRQSLNPDEILAIAVRELGHALRICRCLAYCCKPDQAQVTLTHTVSAPGVTDLRGQIWPLATNPLFQSACHTATTLSLADTAIAPAPDLTTPDLTALIEQWQITSWMIVPIYYRDKFLGVMELHHCGPLPRQWSNDEVELVEAIALQLGGALIQAQAYADLEDLNEQLEALDRTRSNLIAITGHELRTPLSTIQVCLESLASEPDMPLELRQVMLSTALEDAERLRELVRDFLTLSRLESGRVEWNLESLPLQECVDLALSSIHAHVAADRRPKISSDLQPDLPPVRADGEWLVELLSKLLDNACKFTAPQGQITIQAELRPDEMLEVTVADTGRGIEPNRLETVFDRFYQEEGSLRRTVGGTGLGLAICRQIARGLGGKIWAKSDGKDCGSQFHFTLPIIDPAQAEALDRPLTQPATASRRTGRSRPTRKKASRSSTQR